MIALNRSHITAGHTDQMAEALFHAEVSDGKRYEVRVAVNHGGQRGSNYAQGLIMRVWSRIEDYGWEGGTTFPTLDMSLTITEVK